MLASILPKTVDLLRIAKEGLCIEGHVSLSDLTRLDDVTMPPRGQVDVQLKGLIDKLGHPLVAGKIQSELRMICQRCLGPMVYPIDLQFVWAPVKTEAQIEMLPETYEAIEFKGEPLELIPLIEDEILLDLPFISTHSPQRCKIQVTEDSEHKVEQEQVTHKPFARLANLRPPSKK